MSLTSYLAAPSRDLLTQQGARRLYHTFTPRQDFLKKNSSHPFGMTKHPIFAFRQASPKPLIITTQITYI